ncbi:TonB-dependent receptor [Niveispirillum fermenti]|uniref:TonB-dependent receptor n=1 Tax=Niveispirillum fermenti TaxID=1233113 RepID=UPI003A857B36
MASTCLVHAGSALAQGAPLAGTGDDLLAEIIVTAQRRSEALQDVPIAVSAFSEEALKAARLDSAANLALQVPNLNYSQQLYGSSNFQIRGIGYTLVTTAGDQGVGVAENYAPIDRARITDAEFYDVERVEVLRGPQGTLYGRNATGGVINIITNKPELGTNGGSLTGEYGNYDMVRLKGALNLSPDEKVGFRVAGFYVDRDGTMENVHTGNKIDERSLWSTRTSLRVEPTETFRVTGIWEHFSENDSRYGVRQACINDPGPASVGGVTINSPVARAFLSEGCTQASIYAAGALRGTNNSGATLSGQLATLTGYISGDVNAGVVQPDDLRKMAMSIDPTNDVNSDNYQLSLEWDLNEELSLSSITNHNLDKTIQSNGLPQATTPFNVRPLTPGSVFDDPQIGPSQFLTANNYNVLRQKQWSQEFRLQSDYGGMVDFNLGAFYYKAKRHNDIYFFANGQTLYVKTAVPTAYVDPGRTPDETGHNYYLSHSRYQLTSKAGFGELYVRPSEEFQITLGTRYTHDVKEQPQTPLALLTSGRGLTTGVLQEARFKEWTGRAIAEWNPTKDNMLYASYSRGYKGGGFNAPTTGDPNSAFAPETVDAFEVGSKNTFMGRRLTVNSNGFYYKYNDYQYSVSEGLTTVTKNINTTLYGLELESIFYPLRELGLYFNAGYLKTKVNRGPNNRSVDPYNITGGDPTLVALKNTSIACVGPAAGVARLISAINAGLVPASALVGACPTAAAPNGAFATNFGLPTSFGVVSDITGNSLPTSPKWTISFGAQYDFELMPDWTLSPRADFHYQGSVFGDIYNNQDNKAKGWSNVNATLTLSNPTAQVTIQAWAKNLFNKDAITSVGVNSASLGLTRRLYLLEPRTFGISVTKEF